MEENNEVKLEEKMDNSANVECKHKQKNSKLVIWFGVAIAILACIGSFFLGHSLAKNENGSSKDSKDKDELKEENKVEVNENVNNEEGTENSLEPIKGPIYLLEGLNYERRYYLAFDDAKLLDENNDRIDFRTKKVYLMDLNSYGTSDFMQEIDFSSLIEDVYEEKINSLPDVLAAGTVNATKKSECNEFHIRYVESKEDMYDGSNEIPFGIYYACIHDYEGVKNAAELSLGTEYYKLDVAKMKVIK